MIFTVVTSGSCVTVKKINFWYKTAAVGTGIFAISIQFSSIGFTSSVYFTENQNVQQCGVMI